METESDALLESEPKPFSLVQEDKGIFLSNDAFNTCMLLDGYSPEEIVNLRKLYF
jgi:hypothetical protein